MSFLKYVIVLNYMRPSYRMNDRNGFSSTMGASFQLRQFLVDSVSLGSFILGYYFQTSLDHIYPSPQVAFGYAWVEKARKIIS